MAYFVKKNRDLADLSLDELQLFNDQIGDNVFDVLSLVGSLAPRNYVGGTAPEWVRKAIGQARLHISRQ